MIGEEEGHQACVAISLTILMRPKVQYVGPFRFSSKEEMEREKARRCQGINWKVSQKLAYCKHFLKAANIQGIYDFPHLMPLRRQFTFRGNTRTARTGRRSFVGLALER